ncbi:MAG TPA: VOC family protein, partial [Candidatus Onthocola stercorigallinarum]|nr:VOC family protein [Candidatus Onthocola stercorigallinarum]
YSVKNINETITKLQEDGAFLVSPAKEAILFDNKKVAFLMWDLGLIELLEESDDII